MRVHVPIQISSEVLTTSLSVYTWMKTAQNENKEGPNNPLPHHPTSYILLEDPTPEMALKLDAQIIFEVTRAPEPPPLFRPHPHWTRCEKRSKLGHTSPTVATGLYTLHAKQHVSAQLGSGSILLRCASRLACCFQCGKGLMLLVKKDQTKRPENQLVVQMV